jgi:hypothetical protein
MFENRMLCLWRALDRQGVKEDMHPLLVRNEKKKGKGAQGGKLQGWGKSKACVFGGGGVGDEVQVSLYTDSLAKKSSGELGV